LTARCALNAYERIALREVWSLEARSYEIQPATARRVRALGHQGDRDQRPHQAAHRELQGVTEARNVGTIVSVTDGIVRVHGLADAMQGEMLEFPGNTFGLALNLERDSVGAVVLGDYKHLSRRRHGQDHRPHPRSAGRSGAARPRGRTRSAAPIDGKGAINAKRTAPIEKVAPGVIYRKSVSQPVQTGYKSVDSMVPIGRGQRELIIGDRQTGKTAMAIDTIINQKSSGIKCVYVAIGQKQSTIANVVRKLEEHGAMAHTIVVAASASNPAAMQYIAAYSGVHDGRVLHGQRRRRPDHLRRSVQAGRRLSPDLAAAAPPAGSRSVSRRRVLSPLASARAQRARQRGVRRDGHRRAPSRARPVR
jgi:proton translocating ATP synthase F1 alpha subunit